MFAASAISQTAPVRVGSKIDTEGKLLGRMMVLALEANCIKTTSKVSLGNTQVMRGAITAGEITCTRNTPATARLFLQKKSPVWKNLQARYERVKGLDYAKNNIVWLPPTTSGRLLCAKT